MSLACPSIIAALDASLCIPVDIYCERTSAALDAEPINALSNVALLFSSWFAWRCLSKRVTEVAGGIAHVLIVMIAMVGFGSFLFHTVATRWAEWGDVLPILTFIVLYLWLILERFFGWPFWRILISLAFFLASSLYLEARVSAAALSGGVMYLPTIFAVIAISTALYCRRQAASRPMIAATGVFICAFAARTLDMRVCSVFPLGTHFLWHLLSALFLYLLMRLAILHLPIAVPSEK